MKNLAIIITLLLILQSCYTKDASKVKSNPYSISLGSFVNYEKAFEFKSNLNTVVRANLRLEYVSKKNYQLFYGKFSSSIAAGEKAYELFCDTLIVNYDIARDGINVVDEFINVPFIANFVGKPCVFNYNIITKRTELLWNKQNEKVISLNLTKDANYAFITTAMEIGKVGGFPSIKNAILYFLNRNEDNVQQLEELGDGYQLYTYWDSPDSFRVNLAYSDLNNARIIYQKIRTWDSVGNKKSSIERSFDMLKQGFPSLPTRKPQFISPNRNYELRSVANSNQIFFYLKDFTEKSEVLISSFKDLVKDVRWSSDGNYFFIITEHKSKSEKKQTEVHNRIYIADASSKQVKKIIEGTGFENLLVRGKLVFYDELFKNTHRIAIYNYQLNNQFGFIDMPGGCALNTFIY